MEVKKKRYFNIGQVSKILDVAPATIRNWEKAGIFVASRSENNYRIYSFRDIEILKRIFDYSIRQNMNMKMIKKFINQDELALNKDEEDDCRFNDLVKNERFKTCRKQMGLSKAEVSNNVGITEEMLTGIENGTMDITYGIMAKLAILYGEGIFSFLDLEVHSMEPVIRHGKGKIFASGLKGVDIECLTEDVGGGIQVLKFKVQPRCGSYISHLHQYGNDFIYILEGELHVTLDNRNKFVIKENDSIRFSSTRFHSWSNENDSICIFLWTHSVV